MPNDLCMATECAACLNLLFYSSLCSLSNMTRHNNHILDLHIAMPKQRMSIVLHVKISGPFMQHKGRVCMRMTRQIALG